jgi:amino acid permease
MCLLIAIALLAAAYNFYEKGFETQAIMSAFLALLIFVFFTYRIIKNGRCVFGNDKDCNKSKKEK